MNAVAFHIQSIPDYQTFKMTTKSFQSQCPDMAGCNSSLLMFLGGLLHRLRVFIVANVWRFSGPLQRGQDGRAVCEKCQ